MKRGLCIISMIMLLIMNANAEEHILGLQSTGIRLVVYNDKGNYRYGITNQSGDNLGITYSYIGVFQDGYAVFKNDRYGVLNLNGETIIQPVYDFIRYRFLFIEFHHCFIFGKPFITKNDYNVYLKSCNRFPSILLFFIKKCWIQICYDYLL